MKAKLLIVGIGNPGEEYDGSRHNAGWAFLDYISRDDFEEFSFEKKWNADIAIGKLGSLATVLAKPHTFVNKSGESVGKLKRALSLKPEQIVLVHDDLDIEFGMVKLSLGKDAGGHKGVASIIGALKTNAFWRLRIGIANSSLVKARRQSNLAKKKEAVGDFVLSKFTPSERTAMNEILKEALSRLKVLLHA